LHRRKAVAFITTTATTTINCLYVTNLQSMVINNSEEKAIAFTTTITITTLLKLDLDLREN